MNFTLKLFLDEDFSIPFNQTRRDGIVVQPFHSEDEGWNDTNEQPDSAAAVAGVEELYSRMEKMEKRRSQEPLLSPMLDALSRSRRAGEFVHIGSVFHTEEE